MATHAGAGGEGALQIDLVAGDQIAEVGATQGFGRQAHGESVSLVMRRRQAHAVDRNAVAQVEIPADNLCVNGQMDGTALAVERPNAALFLDDSGKHAASYVLVGPSG